MAMVGVFIGVAETISVAPISAAIVQNADLSNRHIQTAISLSLVLAAVLSGGLWLFAGNIADFYNTPELAHMMQWLCLGIFLSIASAVPRGLLMKKMAYHRIMQIDVSSFVIGMVFVCVTLAFQGYGAWSLVWGTLVWHSLRGMLMISSAGTLFRFSFHTKEAKELGHFGLGVSLNGMIHSIRNLSIEAIIGRELGASALGNYGRAMRLANQPIQRMTGSISEVMFTAYSGMQDDFDKLSKLYLRNLRLVAVTAIPALAMLFVSGKYFVLGLYGEHWSEAVSIFQWLCIAAALDSILHKAGAVIQATGKIYKELHIQLVAAVIFVGGVVLVIDEGLSAVVIMMVNVSLLLYILKNQLVIQTIGTSWKQILGAQAPALLIASPVLLSNYLVISFIESHLHLSYELGLLAVLVTSLLIYGAMIFFLPDHWLGGLKELLTSRLRRRDRVTQ